MRVGLSGADAASVCCRSAGGSGPTRSLGPGGGARRAAAGCPPAGTSTQHPVRRLHAAAAPASTHLVDSARGDGAKEHAGLAGDQLRDGGQVARRGQAGGDGSGWLRAAAAAAAATRAGAVAALAAGAAVGGSGATKAPLGAALAGGAARAGRGAASAARLSDVQSGGGRHAAREGGRQQQGGAGVPGMSHAGCPSVWRCGWDGEGS